MNARDEAYLGTPVDLTGRQGMNKAKIVTLCGSTRFWNQMAQVAIEESAKGNIVLSANINFKSPWHNGILAGLAKDPEEVKRSVDELHFRKIDISDEVIVLNVGGYVGESTVNEIRYAIEHRKPVRFLEPDSYPAAGRPVTVGS